MIDRRFVAAAAAAGFVAAVGVWPTSAQAHGAPVNPINRASVCAVGGPGVRTPVCLAALAANGQPFGSFDNLRVPGVAGNDRLLIPDGQLCSAGLPAFGGLDLARSDWPATSVSAGATMTVQYRATIAHQGSFRIYLTRAGYDPSVPLRWQDLGTDPIATVSQPTLHDGEYRLSATLPSGLSGRHLLYTVWQTSDTPDTYYSCSDLDLTPAVPGSGAGDAPAPVPNSSTLPGSSTFPRPSVPARTSAAGGSATSPAAPAAPVLPDVAKPLIPGSRSGGAPVVESVPGSASPPARQSWLARPQPVLDEKIALGQQLVSAALVVVVGVTLGLGVLRLRAARAARNGIHRRVGKR